VTNTTSERIETIDILRGFALFGILLIHVPIFARPGAPPGLNDNGPLLNDVLLAGLITFVEAKFFSLFALLFGVSFALQWRRAERKREPFAPRFRRRLLFLALFGVAHIVLLWEGDILLLYALVGLLLVPLREAPPPKLLRWAGALLLVPLLFYALAFAGLALARQHPASAALIAIYETQFTHEFAASRAAVISRYASPDYVQALVERTQAYIAGAPLLLTCAPSVLAMFLLGFFIGKLGLLERAAQHTRLLRHVRAWGLGLGLVASLLVTLAYETLPPFAAFTALGFNQALAGPLLALGYAAALVLLLQNAAWQRRLRPLASYGRLALTNYLLQSALCAALFYGTGLGLVMDVSPWQAIGLALALNGALILFSRRWLRSFGSGPAEWLWRSLTAGRLLPLRRSPQPAAAAPTGARRRDTPLDPRQPYAPH
jgi:uncharacterized protein